LEYEMTRREQNLWQGIDPGAQNALNARDYRTASLAPELAQRGVDASELVAADRSKRGIKRVWIPGVEIFSRTIYPQRHRGVFGEFVRRDEGVLARIGLWPKQWSAARMFAHTAKGFHIHPPSIPADTTPEKWHRRLFVTQADNYALRRYDTEQWDVMFFLQGRVEMILRDVRAGLPARTMRFFIDGDNHRSRNNVGVVIPPGVAHAIRLEGFEDAIMVYGTSTIFHPEFEGRIASEIESAELPESWQNFLGRGD
jgi:dTDP-4-dehydrorhamnose 3,5-epimerase-like enzyme